MPTFALISRCDCSILRFLAFDRRDHTLTPLWPLLVQPGKVDNNERLAGDVDLWENFGSLIH